MIKKLIRIYTPFICAIAALIHGVLYLFEIDCILKPILGELTGHSVLLILYILATSKRMCKWYEITNYFLISIHAINVLYIYGYLDYFIVLYIGIILNILALISFLIYRATVGITKFLC